MCPRTLVVGLDKENAKLGRSDVRSGGKGKLSSANGIPANKVLVYSLLVINKTKPLNPMNLNQISNS